MAKGKTSTLTFRIEPDLKEALRTAADGQHRSIANMVKVMIRDYCGRNGVSISEQGAVIHDNQKPAKRSQSARHKKTPCAKIKP